MDKVGVYVSGSVNIPSRFWEYSLITSLDEINPNCKYCKAPKESFVFSQKDTDLYNSLSDEEKKKINFRYVNGVRYY